MVVTDWSESSRCKFCIAKNDSFVLRTEAQQSAFRWGWGWRLSCNIERRLRDSGWLLWRCCGWGADATGSVLAGLCSPPELTALTLNQ